MGEGRGIYSVAMFQKKTHDFCRASLFGACRFLLCKNRGRKRPLIKIVRGKPPKVSPSHAPLLAS